MTCVRDACHRTSKRAFNLPGFHEQTPIFSLYRLLRSLEAKSNTQRLPAQGLLTGFLPRQSWKLQTIQGHENKHNSAIPTFIDCSAPELRTFLIAQLSIKPGGRPQPTNLITSYATSPVNDVSTEMSIQLIHD